jgi:hypothetical protein
MAAGFTSQVAHAGGPPFQIYVLPRRLPRDAFIGTSAIFFAVVNWMKVPAYFALGAFTPKVLATAGVLLPLAIASTWAGVWLVRRVPAEGFYKVIYVLLVAVGGKLVFDGAHGLLSPLPYPGRQVRRPVRPSRRPGLRPVRRRHPAGPGLGQAGQPGPGGGDLDLCGGLLMAMLGFSTAYNFAKADYRPCCAGSTTPASS